MGGTKKKNRGYLSEAKKRINRRHKKPIAEQGEGAKLPAQERNTGETPLEKKAWINVTGIL